MIYRTTEDRRTNMTIFRLKQLASTSVHAAADAIGWNYDRVELLADGIVHIVGVCLGLIAASVLVVLTAIYATALEIAVVSVYVAGLLSMLVLSATYNLWPVSRTKWVLRRFDHSAIYVLIAATYTPFIVELKDSIFAVALLIGVWCMAIFGIVLKLKWPGRFYRLSVGLYLALGWSGQGDRRRYRSGSGTRGCHSDWRGGLQMRCRKGERRPSRHRGNRAPVRPDRTVLLKCRGCRRF